MSPVAVGVEIPGSLRCIGADFKLFSAGEVNGCSGQPRHVTAGAQSWKIGLIVVVICSDMTFNNTVKQLFPSLVECVILYFFPCGMFLKKHYQRICIKHGFCCG